jgi:hypothetical protein
MDQFHFQVQRNGPYVEGNNAELRLRGATPPLPHTFE